jgi:hypothetical protein
MRTKEGFVTAYASSDAGGGDAAWLFSVDGQDVSTTNPRLADTMRFALESNKKVTVDYDETDNNKMSRARIEF